MPAPHPRMHGLVHGHGGADPVLIAWEDVGGSSSSGYPDYETGVRSISSLVGYWRLGEGASPYADTSGYKPADPATAVRTAGTTAMTQNLTPGAPIADDDGAVQFNAAGSAVTPVSGDYLACAYTTDLTRFGFTGTAAFSAAFWIRPLASATSWVGPAVGNVASYSGGSFYDGWAFGMTWPSRVLAFSRCPHIAPGGSFVSASSPAGLAAATWQHVAGSYDGTTLRLYLNGTLVASQADTGSIGNGTNPPSFGIGVPSPLPSIYNAWFYGGLDEIAVWSKALTAAEVATLYASGT